MYVKATILQSYLNWLYLSSYKHSTQIYAKSKEKKITWKSSKVTLQKSRNIEKAPKHRKKFLTLKVYSVFSLFWETQTFHRLWKYSFWNRISQNKTLATCTTVLYVFNAKYVAR